jgi:hypothetical protein
MPAWYQHLRGVGVGVTKLSELEIDADKDWNAKKITNLSELSVGDISMKYGWRIYEAPNGIYLNNSISGEIFKIKMERVKKGGKEKNENNCNQKQ